MKKIIVPILLITCIRSFYAQDLTSKKGEPILPEAKDWAISVDATPFLITLVIFLVNLILVLKLPLQTPEQELPLLHLICMATRLLH